MNRCSPAQFPIAYDMNAQGRAAIAASVSASQGHSSMSDSDNRRLEASSDERLSKCALVSLAVRAGAVLADASGLSVLERSPSMLWLA